MANPTVYFAYSLLGGGERLDYVEVDEAVKRGDVLVSATDKSHAARLDDNAEFALGVATHDSAVNTICAYVPAAPWNVFAFLLSGNYDDSADRYTYCDFDVFTTGAMAINPGTDSTHMVWLFGRRDGNDISITAAAGDVDSGGEILGIFGEARYVPAQVMA